MTLRTRVVAASIGLLLATTALLLAMGQPPICTCGSVDLWVGSADSPRTSQMLADWYSFSHVVHGFLFYFATWLFLRRQPVARRFLIALAIEAGWELLENTPMIIDYYRQKTIAIGYSGDSVLNSLSDIAMMATGFAAARKLPVWSSLVAVLALEIFPLLAIRDNLTLNVWMFVAPSAELRAWQSGQ